ncbi:glycosyltransferase family 2 protein [Oscillatoria sp. CS-180]|uniref:glycosyltransferase family 2 protein n=1 Tax=Oscillatoria sp. CS-180 TaxID=3021720 RepID=UPI002330A8FC|nr:glycosyltransferase family 2 protein [Oscillatoria sp. CS-180]MDB9525412.1 glycosyltransferase family 2 protein [Oscillatoria sp. CS-180]
MTCPLSVITVTHNHAAYIGRCLATVVPEVLAVGGEMIVIDNLSTDHSADIARHFEKVKLVVNSERRGFSANNNYGMAIAQGRYILLLNPDTEMQPGALKELIRFMDTHPEVGLCGAQLLFPDGTVQPSPRRFPTIGAAIARRTPLRHLLKNSASNRHHLMLDVSHTQPFAVDWLLGACMFIRREVLNTVGPLDEGFYLYVEDIDWAKRIHNAGWEVFYVPAAKIIHHHLAISDKKLLSYHMWLHLKSMFRYARRYCLPTVPGLSARRIRTTVWDATQPFQPTRFWNRRVVIQKNVKQEQ